MDVFQVHGGKQGAERVARDTGMSLIEHIFEEYFLLEVPHIHKRYVKYFISMNSS